VSESRAPGLRLQILLALAGLMLLAFFPLFFAVASLTRATLAGAHEASASAVAEVVARHAGDAWAGGGGAPAVARALASDVGDGRGRQSGASGGSGGDAVAARAFDASGAVVAGAGDDDEVAAIAAPGPPVPGAGPTSAVVRGAHGRALDVTSRQGELTVVVRMRLVDDAERGSPLVRLVALYMITFGLALLTFAYFSLTRLIVRPVEALAAAADRVAHGSRTLTVPSSGARELADLSASVQAMTTSLVASEAAMRAKVEELTQARAQLVRSERMASVGRLAAGVAHEIGNPITAIMGMEDLILEGGLAQDEQNDFLRRMKRETERIHVVLHDLLDFARPEAAAPSGAPVAPADVREVADSVAALVRPQKSFKAVTVAIELPDEPLAVRLPGPRLTQVLLNLVLNAGAAIADRKRDGRVVIRARRESGAPRRVRIEVEDDGPGVPGSMRERIFEPFVTTKEVGEGSGLGLAVCRGLVESAGGEIGVDPAYAAGARFYVVLPAAASADAHPASAP
jgi:signal transduction histidine kinase